MAKPRICSVEDCGKRHYGRGFCIGHWQRWKKHGDPKAGKTPHGEMSRFFREVVLPYDGDQCLVWPYSRTVNGYAQLNCGRQKLSVHRLVCEDAYGPPPTRLHEVAHSCGNRSCVARTHLRWATHVENEADKLAHGTHQFGERNPQSRLTDAEVEQIRALRGQQTQREIAAKFNVSQSAVSFIQTGSRWPSGSMSL